MPDVYNFELTRVVDSVGTVGVAEHAALLPHEVFHTVWLKATRVFETIFTGGAGALEEWS